MPRSHTEAAILSSFLGRLPGGVREAVLRGATLHHVDAGRVFLDEGESDWAGIVVSGLVRVYLHPSEGHQVAVAHLRPGGAVGVAALVGADHPVNAQAISATTILELSVRTVREWARRDQRVLEAIADELARRLKQSYDELAIRGHGSVRQRLARELLDLATPDGGGERLIVTQTHEGIAYSIGSSRVVVSRVLAAFRDERLVDLGRSRMVLLNPVQLHLIAFARTGYHAARYPEPHNSAISVAKLGDLRG